MKSTLTIHGLVAAALLLGFVGCASEKASQSGNNPATASAGSTSGSGSVSAKAEQAHHRQ